MSVAAPAKLNLRLAVKARRPDGYHELDTVLLALDRCDTIELERRGAQPGEDRLRLSVSGPAFGPDVPVDATNLAWRAVAGVLALAERRGLGDASSGWDLRLVKRIPTQAGLGGGSSDAAAAALAAARLLGIEGDDPELSAVVAGLGSDCAFFLAARASGLARCTGRGERVEPLEMPATERAFCVFTPDVGCPTAAVYAALREGELSRDPLGAFDAELVFQGPLEEARAMLANALEPAALRARPALVRWRARLNEGGGAHFRLCGSGSSFFGMFADVGAARAFLEEHLTARNARDDGLRGAFIARPWSSDRDG